MIIYLIVFTIIGVLETATRWEEKQNSNYYKNKKKDKLWK
jgi:hypothetical protein